MFSLRTGLMDRKPPHRKFLLIGILLTGAASFFGLGHMVTTAIQKVSAGHGLETYHTVWLAEFNWIGFLVAIIAIPIALIIALGFRFYEQRQWYWLEKKYYSRKRDSEKSQ